MPDAVDTKPHEARKLATNRPRVVFISHKREDQGIAVALARRMKELASEKLEIYLSDHPDFKGARHGELIADEIAEQLMRTEVFVFVYTGRSKDYSWCTWEAGLAVDPRSAQGTRIIVFTTVDDAPSLFAGRLVVRANEVESIKQFLRDFCTSADFFPGGRGPLLAPGDEGPILRLVFKDAEDLHDELVSKFPPGERREVPRWPSIAIELSKADAGEFVSMVESAPQAFAHVSGPPSAPVAFFLDKAIVIHSEEGGSKVFDYTWEEKVRVPLVNLRKNWLDVRKSIADEGLGIAENKPWDCVLAEEVYKICTNKGPSLEWSPFLDLRDRSSWLYPLISASFINPDGSREFRIRLVPFLSPGAPVPGE